MVSPGLTSRPSLSVRGQGAEEAHDRRVSPGLTSRPSLSECDHAAGQHRAGRVSPGLTSRPSLSVTPYPIFGGVRRTCRRA